MRGAGGEQGGLVWEVAIDRGAADAGELGHGADRRLRRPYRSVQLDGALGDAPTGLGLELRAALLPVGPLLVGH